MCFGVALSLEWVDSLEQEPNLISTRYGRVEMTFHAYARGRKIDGKSFPSDFFRKSHNSCPATGAFFEFGCLKMVPKSSPGRLGSSPGPLGRSRVALGAPSGALERSRGALGTLLERSWGDHERSWERLDEFGPSLGRFLALWESILTIRSSILGSQRISFGVSARYACDNASDIEFRNDLLPFFA